MVNDFLKKLTRTDDQELFNFGGAWIKSVIIRGTAYELIRGNNPKHYPKSYWSVCFTTIDMDTLQPNEVIQFTFRPTKNAIEFVTIATKNRKSAKGLNSHSTNVLRFICDLADETQVQLFGAVEPLEEDGLSEEKLYRWYKLFNFFKNGLSELSSISFPKKIAKLVF